MNQRREKKEGENKKGWRTQHSFILIPFNLLFPDPAIIFLLSAGFYLK